MTDMQEGLSARIVKLDGGAEFKRKLRVMGIREGKTLLLVTEHPFGGPVVVEVDDRKMTLGRHMAERIMVEVK